VEQDLTTDGGVVLATGSSAKIGNFAARGLAWMPDKTGAKTALVSVPFTSIHKMHDLAKEAILMRHLREHQEHGGMEPFSMRMENLQQPGANMLLLQVSFCCICTNHPLGCHIATAPNSLW
jgi:hypothetical protein